MGVGQNLVDLADPAQPPGDRIEAGQAAAGGRPGRSGQMRRSGRRWLPAHLIAAGAPAREAESLGRHVIQCRGEGGEALARRVASIGS